MTEKVCSRCGEGKPLEAYAPRGKGARRASCRECHRAMSRRWKAENPEKVRAYEERTRERRRKHERAWRAAHPEFMRDYRKVAAPLYAEHERRRRARKRGAEADVVGSLRRAEGLEGLPCQYCGQSGDQVDHVVSLARGGSHSPMNLVSACGTCNCTKHARHLGEFLADHPTNDWQVVVTRMAAASLAGQEVMA